MSRNGPERSVSTPIRIVCRGCCALIRLIGKDATTPAMPSIARREMDILPPRYVGLQAQCATAQIGSSIGTTARAEPMKRQQQIVTTDTKRIDNGKAERSL